MLGNLYVEIKNKRITQTQIAKLLNLSINSVNFKIRGKSEFTRQEMFLIQEKLFPDKELEYLFRKLEG